MGAPDAPSSLVKVGSSRIKASPWLQTKFSFRLTRTGDQFREQRSEVKRGARPLVYRSDMLSVLGTLNFRLRQKPLAFPARFCAFLLSGQRNWFRLER